MRKSTRGEKEGEEEKEGHRVVEKEGDDDRFLHLLLYNSVSNPALSKDLRVAHSASFVIFYN